MLAQFFAALIKLIKLLVKRLLAVRQAILGLLKLFAALFLDSQRFIFSFEYDIASFALSLRYDLFGRIFALGLLLAIIYHFTAHASNNTNNRGNNSLNHIFPFFRGN